MVKIHDCAAAVTPIKSGESEDRPILIPEQEFMREIRSFPVQAAETYRADGATTLAPEPVGPRSHLRLVASNGVSLQGELVPFAPRLPESQKTVLFEDASGIADDVRAIQKDWIQEEVAEDEMYLLPGTGFDVKGEIDRFSRNILRFAEEGKALDEVLGTVFLELGGNIYGYSLEYLRSKAMLPFKHEIITDNDGKLRLKPFGYDGFLRDAISPQERYGAVVQSIETLEEKLPHASVGDIFVMTSPSGWTGFAGKTYVETQTKLMEVTLEEGKPVLRGHTIRSMMDVSQNIAFMDKLGADTGGFFDPDDRRQLAEISAAVKHLSGDHGETITSLVKSIQEIVGSEVAYEGYTFENIYKDIPNFPEHFAADQLTMEHERQLEGYITEILCPVWESIVETGKVPDEIVGKMQKATGMTVLRLSNAITRERNGGKIVISESGNLGEIMRGKKRLDFDARAQLHEDQQKPGCNGGGKKEGANGKKYMIVITANGARLVEFDGESYDYDQPGPCRECGRDILCGPCQMCLECDIKKRDEEETPMAA